MRRLQSLQILGSFDTPTLLPSFSAMYEPPDAHESHGATFQSRDQLLKDVPSSVLAHEFAHVAHTLGTAAGLREHLISIGEYALRRELVSRAMQVTAGVALQVPLLDSVTAYQHDADFRLSLRQWNEHLIAGHIYAGGLRTSDNADTAVVWMAANLTFGRNVNPWPIPHVFLGAFEGPQESVACGFLHLTEGVAKIAERIQRRLSGEPGEASPFGQVRLEENFFREFSSPIDPYYVADVIFTQRKDRFAASTAPAAYEEHLWLLADLSMMVDPLLTPQAFHALYSNPAHADGLDLAAAEWAFTPAVTFVLACEIFWQHAADLPPLINSDSLTSQAHVIQDAVVGLMIPGASMASLTEECRTRLRDAAPGLDLLFRDQSETVRDYFQNTAFRWLGFRLDVLKGGAFIEDLLTSRETLLTMFDRMVPAYTVGTTIAGSIKSREGETIGVDQANVQVFDDFTKALVYGNGPCHLSEAARGERSCILPAVALCHELPGSLPPLDRDTYCTRDQVLQKYQGWGLSELVWRPEMATPRPVE